MSLTADQSGPGNRFNGPDGKDYDVIARVSTDRGPFVIVCHPDAGLPAGVLVDEGYLRDHEDVAYVGTTADAKAKAAADQQAQEDAQIAADRQARIDAQAQAEAPATDATDTTDASGNGGAVPTPNA